MTRLKRLVGIDERSLALFRIGLASVVLVDLVLRSTNLGAHYSDAGAVPRALIDGLLRPDSVLFQLYSLHGSTAWAAFLFLLSAAAALALLIGVRTPWAAAATCFLVFSLHARSPTVAHGGDDLMRLLLLWAVVLPLGGYGSIDSRRFPSSSSPQIASLATFGVQFHLTVLFWIVPLAAGIGARSLLAPTALADVLHDDSLLTTWGVTLRSFPELVQFGDLMLGGLVLLAPLLVWSPVFTGLLRTLFVLCLLQFEILGVAPALNSGIHPWVVAVASTLFLPGWLWNQVTESARTGSTARAPHRPSALRNGAAALILMVILFAAFQDLARGRSPSGGDRSPTVGTRLGIGIPRTLLLPAEASDNGWIITRGLLEDGTERDIWRDSAVSYEKPGKAAKSLGGSRWRQHLTHLSSTSDDVGRSALLAHLCRAWNEADQHPSVVEVELVFMLDRQDSSGGDLPALPVPLGTVRCVGENQPAR